eukprot:364080-Chlamydomonas_euryale.AAC.7
MTVRQHDGVTEWRGMCLPPVLEAEAERQRHRGRGAEAEAGAGAEAEAESQEHAQTHRVRLCEMQQAIWHQAAIRAQPQRERPSPKSVLVPLHKNSLDSLCMQNLFCLWSLQN